jgi:hypothetical protein
LHRWSLAAVPTRGVQVAAGAELNLMVPARTPCCQPDTATAAGRPDACATAPVEPDSPSAAATNNSFLNMYDPLAHDPAPLPRPMGDVTNRSSRRQRSPADHHRIVKNLKELLA